jgi:hypothetical protein
MQNNLPAPTITLNQILKVALLQESMLKSYTYLFIFLSIYLSIYLTIHCTEALDKVNGLYYRKSSIWISSTSETPSNANNWERKKVHVNTQQKLWRF